MLSWKCHISQILSRLSSACCAVNVITPLMSEDILKLICYSRVHSMITYGIIFWGNSPHSTDNFKIQKRIIWIMTKSRSRDTCRQLFKRLEFLPLQSQFIFSVLLLFVGKINIYVQPTKKSIMLPQDRIQVYNLQRVT